MSGGHIRDVHVFSRDGVAWGLIIDDGNLSGGTHENVPGNGGNDGGIQIVNESAAAVQIEFADGGGATVGPGSTSFLPGDSQLFDYQIDYGSASPGPQDLVRLQTIAEPFEQNGVSYDAVVNFEVLLDLGGATLGSPGSITAMRMNEQIDLTVLSDAGIFALDPLDVTGKFMLTPVPEPTTAILATLALAITRRRRR